MEDYGRIKEIVKGTIDNSIATQQFRYDLLIPQMESQFKRCGFRETTGGGGTEDTSLATGCNGRLYFDYAVNSCDS